MGKWGVHAEASGEDPLRLRGGLKLLSMAELMLTSVRLFSWSGGQGDACSPLGLVGREMGLSCVPRSPSSAWDLLQLVGMSVFHHFYRLEVKHGWLNKVWSCRHM